jgi:benzoyl-CoA reductase/2-hydroxyglutaryl-CoA dehydratase subunit BcrC/BadD/HgdB
VIQLHQALKEKSCALEVTVNKLAESIDSKNKLAEALAETIDVKNKLAEELVELKLKFAHVGHGLDAHF